MNIFGIGLPEMAVILVLALLVFGPKKLPEIGRSLGKTIKELQNASKQFEEELKKEAQEIEKTVVSPMKATLDPQPPKVLSPQDQEAPAEMVVEPTVADATTHSPAEDGAASPPAGSPEAGDTAQNAANPADQQTADQ